MANITMRNNKTRGRVFKIRVKVSGEMFTKTWPGKYDDPIPDTWSDKTAWKKAEKNIKTVLLRSHMGRTIFQIYKGHYEK